MEKNKEEAKRTKGTQVTDEKDVTGPERPSGEVNHTFKLDTEGGHSFTVYMTMRIEPSFSR